MPHGDIVARALAGARRLPRRRRDRADLGSTLELFSPRRDGGAKHARARTHGAASFPCVRQARFDRLLAHPTYPAIKDAESLETVVRVLLTDKAVAPRALADRAHRAPRRNRVLTCALVAQLLGPDDKRAVAAACAAGPDTRRKSQ